MPKAERGLRSGLLVGVLVVSGLGLGGCRGCASPDKADVEKPEDRPKKVKLPEADVSDAARTRFKATHPMLLEGLPAQERTLAEPVAAAKELLLEGGPQKAADARALLADWLPEHADDADALYWRARSWSIEKIFEQSIPDYTAALEADAEFAAPRWWLAAELYELDQCADAMEHLDALVAQYPDEPRATYNRALCTMQVGERSVAREEIQRACDAGLEEACPRRGKGKGKGRLLSAGERSLGLGKGKGKGGKGKFGLRERSKGKINFQRMRDRKAKSAGAGSGSGDGTAPTAD